MSGLAQEDRTPARSVDDLVDWIAAGAKPRSEWRVGTEHEKIGLRLDATRRPPVYRPLPYQGEGGIGVLLQGIAREDGWTPVFEGENPVALVKDAASITLEPGGQLELSGEPLRTIHETCREFRAHLEVVRRVSEPLGIVWLSLGFNPIFGVSEVPVMPKERYEMMRRYLPVHGEFALEMMHLTATVQANFDFSDEADMAAKMRTALGVSPIVSAIFANSAIAERKASGFVSKRLEVWRHTDPDRCGIPGFVFEPDFGYRRYVEWALDVPMIFVMRGGRHLPANGTTFRSFLERGFEGERATLGDWSLHLTTLFPEVRLKRVLEMRGADAVAPDLICALPALWKGLLYDDEAREAAWSLVAELSQGEREAALGEVARRGLDASIGARPALELAREVVELADSGLRRIGHAGARDPDERSFLDPVRAIVAEGRSPGRVVLDRWEGEWAGSLDRLIEYARY